MFSDTDPPAASTRLTSTGRSVPPLAIRQPSQQPREMLLVPILQSKAIYLHVKTAVHWERPGCALAQSSPNLTWAAMGLRDSARPQRVSGSARTDSRRAESAQNPITAHVKFGDDSALNTPTRTQWTADLTKFNRSSVFYLL